MRKGFWLGVLGIGGLCALAGLWAGAVGAQTEPLPVGKAAALTELPLGAWGPYSRAHIGPCYLANRLLEQLFAFPIVIGQRREELILRPVQTAGNKRRVRPEKAVLERRAMGLSPAQAAEDDRISGEAAHRNRRARILEADGSGLLYRAQVDFLPAEAAQEPATPPNAGDQPAKLPDWGAGAATVEYFPAFADPAADGLLVRVTLSNRSAAPQTYFVDLLGGMDAPAPQFAAADLAVVSGSGEEGVVVQHAKSDAVFALESNANQFPVRVYQVGDAYFGPEGAITGRGPTGAALPVGLLEASAQDAENAGQKGEKESKGDKPAPANSGETTGGASEARRWGLLRVDDIAVAPGESVSFFLCAGVGKDREAARQSAETLLSVAEDAAPFDKPRAGAYSLALAEHGKARFAGGDAALDRLMAQSLVNVPFGLYRRVGVPSRQETQSGPGGRYVPEAGGYIALGWIPYRPDWTAAQLNAWLVTTGSPDAPIPHPQAVPPTNLFALWELYQRTHDRELLARCYPFARRRYRELLTAGRVKPDTWLFAWPEDSDGRQAGKGGASRVYAPDYSAYVIRAAKLLRLMAAQSGQSVTETQQYTQDIAEATRALNGLWDAQHSRYAPQAVSGGTEEAPDTLRSLLPLIAGVDALKPEQRAALLKALTDPAAFWSEAGVRSVSKSAPGYRLGAGRGGAVSLGASWLIWKALLDLGETETARKLAENVLRAYHKAQTASDSCPEWLDGDTGAAGGATDYSGDACAVLALYAAYRLPGTLSTGWDTNVLDQRYDKAADSLHVVFKALGPGGKSALICVMGKPSGKYQLSGDMNSVVTADAQGVLTITPPDDPGTRQIDITPIAGAGT